MTVTATRTAVVRRRRRHPAHPATVTAVRLQAAAPALQTASRKRRSGGSEGEGIENSREDYTTKKLIC